ncbi:MAG: ferrous iron transport protein B [Desulforegulaceae bacterium]|nr:ferrous iron transport protein B [Desulforegulaceae bacterium]
MTDNHLTIALAGNPNSGKTSIFNAITGTRQKVGNWAGVTVEKKEGFIEHKGRKIKLVDLPGIYSLTPFSIEEVVTRNYLIDETPDVVIDIIDSTNLERALYLALQIRELDLKVVFALNMADILENKDIYIDDSKLSELLALPIVFTIGNRGEGMTELLDESVNLALHGKKAGDERKVKYSSEIEKSIGRVSDSIKDLIPENSRYSLRWTSVRLLENDRPVFEQVDSFKPNFDLKALVKQERQRLRTFYNDEPELVMTDERYGFIEGIIREVLHTPLTARVDISRKIDSVLTNRFLGLPIFAFFIWFMFQATFTLGQYPMDWLERFVVFSSEILTKIIPDGILQSLVVDGVISGVGGVLVFLPNILILFFCIALFEDTGYMARAAFLMDKVMHSIGLHGKSFIPMLMGFGCNVPAIMAARTLENDRDRILTILITPFMSCSARLPVYIILAGTFFPDKAGNIIFLLYLTGILVAFGSGKLFRATILRGEEAPFVMELPPYRVPMLKSLLIHMWDRSKIFLKKMGGVILAGSILVWVLSYFPQETNYSKDYDSMIVKLSEQIDIKEKSGLSSETENLYSRIRHLESERKKESAENSYLGRLGNFVSPVFEPIGIDWRGSIALITGFVAKEIVISTMGVLYGVDSGEEDSGGMGAALKRSGMTPLSALSMMVFVLLYLPCLAAIAAVKQESGSLKWTLFSIFYTTFVAWSFSFTVYQVGTLLQKVA